MRDLSFVEEAGQVGFHLGTPGDAHAQGEEATQVFLHQRLLVSV